MVIIGAKGFAIQLTDVILQNNENANLNYFDNINTTTHLLFNKYKIFHSELEVSNYFKNSSTDFCIGVGDPINRRKFSHLFKSLGGKLNSVISPFAHIGKLNVAIKDGVNILTGSIIESGVTIGEGCLINLNSTITHESTIGDYTTISPGVHVSGECTIGDNCFLGTGCVILPKIKIGNNVTIGAGAVVNKNIEDNQTVVGIPAKPINR
jgi:sugar O-acyltransferase (sialic acid O-acetyltransferase NeuD family)